MIKILSLAASFMMVTNAYATQLEGFEQTLEKLRSIIGSEEASIRGAKGAPVFVDHGFLFQENPADDFSTMFVSAAGEKELIADDAEIRTLLEKIVDGKTAPNAWSLKGITEAGRLIFEGEEGRVEVNLQSAKVQEIPLPVCEAPRRISEQFPTTFGPLDETVSPNGCVYATQKDGNLIIRDGRNGKLRALTRDGDATHIWGGTEESSPRLNAFWSPDGSKIAAVWLDESEVPREPILHYLPTATMIEDIPYPRSGEPLQRFFLYIIDVKTGARVEIKVPDTTDHYINILGWRADGEAILYQIVDRAHKSADIRWADISTGKSRRVVRLKPDTYVDTPYTLGPQLATPMPNADGASKNGLLVFSERDGVRNLYVFDEHGEEVAQITSGVGVVHDLISIDVQNGVAYVIASADATRPYDHHLVIANLDGSGSRRITPEQGHHTIWLSPDRSYYVARRSTPTIPPIIEMRDMSGRLMSTVSVADVSALEDAGFSGAEEIWSRSADGAFNMRGVLIKPFNFDATRRYPVVEMVYGGMQLVHSPRDYYGFGRLGSGYNSVPARILLHHGFAVAYIDAPGTPERGRSFQDATYRTWPQGVMENHAKWFQDVAKKHPWLDVERVGIYGSSWGGYMAVRALIDEPNLYKVAVSMAAPQDFEDHPLYIEPFMDRPASNAAGYAAASNLNRLAGIKSPVLVIAYPLDVNSGVSPTMKFIDGMVAEGKEVDVFTVPEVNHRINCCGDVKEMYVYALITRFLRKHLALEPAASKTAQP